MKKKSKARKNLNDNKTLHHQKKSTSKMAKYTKNKIHVKYMTKKILDHLRRLAWFIQNWVLWTDFFII